MQFRGSFLVSFQGSPGYIYEIVKVLHHRITFYSSPLNVTRHDVALCAAERNYTRVSQVIGRFY
jgi:hypothetical protein